MQRKDDRDTSDEFDELEDLDEEEESKPGGLFQRASKRILEYWERRKYRSKTGTTLTLVELEVERVKEQRELDKDLSERFDEPGIGERKETFPFMAYFIYPLIGLLIVGIPVAVVMQKLRAKDLAPPPEREGEAVLPIAESEVSEQSAKQVAEGFLEAPTVEARLAVVRDPETVQVRLADYPAETRAHPIAYQGLRGMGPASASGELRFHRFAVSMANGGMRFLAVLETPRGPLVDYDAFARYGTATWQEILEGATAEELRVFARWSTYHQARFEDESKWVSFELSSPDWPQVLAGYAPKDSATAGTLYRITGKSSTQRVIVKIRPEGDSYLNRQVVIEKVLASGWVRSEGDLEAKWLMKHGGGP